METIDPILKLIAGLWDRITHAPMHLLLIVVLNVVGVMLKRIPQVPNRTIPLILIMLATLAYPQLASPGDVSPDVRHPVVVLGMFGFLLGFGAWMLHLFILRRAAKLLPDWMSDQFDPPVAPLLVGMLPLLAGCVEFKGREKTFTLGVLPKPPTNAVVGVTYTKIGIIVGQNPATQAPELTLGYQRGAYFRVPTGTNGPEATVSSGVTTKQDGLDTTIEEHFRVNRE